MSQKASAAKGGAAQLQEYVTEMAPKILERGADKGPAASAAGSEAGKTAGMNMDMVMSIPVTVKIVLGSATMPVANLVKLGKGAVIPLDRKVGEPVEVVVNGRTVARGEVVLIDEATSRLGISLTEVVSRKGSDKAA
jgi:flagellar motor switch protein FliN